MHWKKNLSKIKRQLIGANARKRPVTLAPTPDISGKDSPDWMYAAQDFYENTKEEDHFFTPWNEKRSKIYDYE